MAGLRGIVAGLVISSAICSLSAAGQSASSVSLTHTVSVSVPARVKVQVASLAFANPASASIASVQPKADGLSITVNATQAWVLSIGSASGVATPKSGIQWSTDASSGYSPVTSATSMVASGSSYDAKSSSVFFRNASDSKPSGRDAGAVVLTVSAP